MADPTLSNDAAILRRTQEMINELNNIKGTNAKKEALVKYGNILPLIKRVWDPNTTTGITSQSLKDFKKKGKSVEIGKFTILGLFDSFTERKVTGDAARASVLHLCELYPQYKDLIPMIYEKDLKMRIGAKTILEVFPGIFQIFEVALSKEFDEEVFARKLEEFKNVHPPAFLSMKVDGVRLLSKMPYEGDTIFQSREGNEFTSLKTYKSKLDKFYLEAPKEVDARGGIVLDGELVELDENGKVDFKATVSAARQKDIQMKNPKIEAFDLLMLDEFESAVLRDKILGERLEMLSKIVKNDTSGLVEMLEQVPYTPAAFEAMKERAKKEGWEGIMIRFNTTYESKRTNNLLKWKLFQTEEYKVHDLVFKDMAFPNTKGGTDTLMCLNSVIIKHKECDVYVGSGFSKEQRLEFYKDPSKIKNKYILVQFQEEFQDKNTKKWSLRLPTLVSILGDKPRDF